MFISVKSLTAMLDQELQFYRDGIATLEQYEHVAGKRWRIVCCSCMAQIDRGHDQTPGILIDLWNTRK